MVEKFHQDQKCKQTKKLDWVRRDGEEHHTHLVSAEMGPASD